MKFGKCFRYAVVVGVLAVAAVTAVGQGMPKPQVRLVERTEIEENGRRFTGYELEVVNRDEFDNELFVPSPALPACGRNANASRTWVNIYNEKGKRIYGHCAMNSNADLASVRFSIPEGGTTLGKFSSISSTASNEKS